MSEWTAIGELASGIPAKLAWNGTSLTGTPEGMAAVHELVAQEEVQLTPTGPWVPANINDEVAAFAMSWLVLTGPEITGEPPDLGVPEIPDGAIA